jgi:hypothetical protein
MSLGVIDRPASGPAPEPGPEAGGSAADPPSRTPPRHRRPRQAPAELAERLWRPPLGLAAGIFAACGPAHALGHTDLVFNAVLVGLTLSAAAVPLGLYGMRSTGPADPAVTESRP